MHETRGKFEQASDKQVFKITARKQAQRFYPTAIAIRQATVAGGDDV